MSIDVPPVPTEGSRVRAPHQVGVPSITHFPATPVLKDGAREHRLGSRLTKLGDVVVALHDRRTAGSRAMIDHLVVGPAGVYVVAVKRYRNAEVTVRRSGGMFSLLREELIVGHRDRTRLATALQRAADAIGAAIDSDAAFAGTPVIPTLCIVDAQFPLFGTLEVGDVLVRGLRGVVKLVASPGPLDTSARCRLASLLDAGLRAR